jgi:hypothetical protein
VWDLPASIRCDPTRCWTGIQSDIVSREQILGHGLTQHVLDRLVRTQSWRRLCPGLYLTVPTAPSFDALAWGGILLGGPRSRLGPDASGHLWQLTERAPEVVDVLVPAGRTLADREHWRFIRERPTARSDRCRGNPPRLGPEDTVLDLSAQQTEGQVIGLVTRAVGSRLTTAARLQKHLDQRSRHRHRVLLRDLLAVVTEGAESPLEVKYVRIVERPHGLPRGDRQSSRAGLHYLSDVRYDEFALLVELDGKLNHDGEGRFRDMKRDNRHALLDELTLRYGWFDVTHRPCTVAFEVHTVLRRRGYDRPFLRCRNCRAVPEADLAGA